MSSADRLASNDKKVQDMVLRGTVEQFDNSKALATTEFVQRAIGGFGRVFGYGTNGQVIPPSQVNSHINLFGTCSTLTLPLLNSVPAGSVIYIGTSSLPCTIFRQGTDTIFLNSTVPASTSITVNDGESVLLVSNGYTWVASGVAALRYSSSFASVLGLEWSSQKLPGLSIKTGFINSTSAAATIPLTFPISFPTNCVALILNGWAACPAAFTHSLRDRSGAIVSKGSNANYQFDYIAIGY